jgi:CubicO group peptidase (beta-lactamase class C family)
MKRADLIGGHQSDGAAAKEAPPLVPARRQIQIKDLLTHTSGMSYGTDSHLAALYEAKGLGPAAGNGWYTADKIEPICTTMERLATPRRR